MSDKKFELPAPEDSWAKVELWRWQYGTLPQPDDMRPLDVAAGLRGMATAIRKGDRDNFPSPGNVVAVLEYAARLIAANKNPKSMLGKLTDFFTADSDMTPEQVCADLEAAGVDVDAFVKRVNETVERCNREVEATRSVDEAKGKICATWYNAPGESGNYFIDNGVEREIVYFDAEDMDVTHGSGICKLRSFTGWKWWGPIQEPPEMLGEGVR